MMHEIKFRAKRKDDGKWVYGDLLRIDSEYYIVNNYNMPVGYLVLDKPDGERICVCHKDLEALIQVDKTTIGQYINWENKENDIDFYEGDIITSITGFDDEGEFEEIYIIKYDCNKCAFMAVYNGNVWDPLEDLDPRIKIIGNIYDNTELLNQTVLIK
jgi:uncharacterized phage protein (TIGR01671 family)